MVDAVADRECEYAAAMPEILSVVVKGVARGDLAQPFLFPEGLAVIAMACMISLFSLFFRTQISLFFHK